MLLVYRSVKVKDLLQDQARAPMDKLTRLLELERRGKAMEQKKGMTRHSRFGTTVAVKAVGPAMGSVGFEADWDPGRAAAYLAQTKCNNC